MYQSLHVLFSFQSIVIIIVTIIVAGIILSLLPLFLSAQSSGSRIFSRICLVGCV